MNTITLKGKILFNPNNETKKQIAHSEWKIVAMVLLKGDICQYYSWFIEKRYNLKLDMPSLRGPHVTFINDRIGDVEGKDENEKRQNWADLAKKWDGKFVDITFDPDVRTDGKHWWMNLPEESRGDLQQIRNEIGLGRPYYGMHLTIGRANEKNIMHSQYIHNCITKTIKPKK